MELNNLNDRSKKLYANLIRQRLVVRMPEHVSLISALSDDDIIEKDRRHNLMKAEMRKHKIARLTPPKLEYK
jgi:hypothetical protein